MQPVDLREQGVETPPLFGAQQSNRRETLVDDFVTLSDDWMHAQDDVRIDTNDVVDSDRHVVAVRGLTESNPEAGA
jgi:hypothetical protein